MPTSSPKWGLETVLGSDEVRSLDDSWGVLTGQLDAIMMARFEGPLASRPVSTPGSPGKSGRFYRANDGGGSVYYVDNGTGWDRLPKVVGVDTATWNPASIANGASASTTVTVSGALLGDIAIASYPSAAAGGTVLSAQVIGPFNPNGVIVTLANLSGGAIDPASATLTVVVLRP